jgi:hypothetical protein
MHSFASFAPLREIKFSVVFVARKARYARKEGAKVNILILVSSF